MSEDFRVSVGLFTHHKFKMLKRKLGADGVLCLFALWAFCVQNKPTGRLDGMTTEEIEIAADWSGEDGLFVHTLLDLRWLELEEDTFIVHDWREHNPYAASSEERSDRARFSKLAQIDKKLHERLKSEGITKISAQEMFELCNRQRNASETQAKRQPDASPVSVSSSSSVSSSIPPHSTTDSSSETITQPPPQPKGEKPAVAADEKPLDLEDLVKLYTWYHGAPSLGQQSDLLKISGRFTSESIVEALEKSVTEAKVNPAGWILMRLNAKPDAVLFEVQYPFMATSEDEEKPAGFFAGDLPDRSSEW